MTGGFPSRTEDHHTKRIGKYKRVDPGREKDPRTGNRSPRAEKAGKPVPSASCKEGGKTRKVDESIDKNKHRQN